ICSTRPSIQSCVMPEPSAAAQSIRAPRAGRFTFALGGAILVAYLLLALLGSRIAPYGLDNQDLINALARPSADHWFGTDALGRDILSRVIIGTQYTLSAAVLSVAIASVIGVIIGIVSG